MPQTKNIDLPTVANFDATLKAAGFKPGDIAGHYVLPDDWTPAVKAILSHWSHLPRNVFEYPVSRALAMYCLCLYVENFAG